jgi:NAD(P)-dependent dehydrogenase (short-subunit alcohol dehydrogenase family)
MFDLTGRTALITGAATGIGQIISKILSKSGVHVAISDKPDAALEETEQLCRPFGTEVLKIAIDVRNIEQIREGFDTAKKKFGRIDILVSNAGINRPAPVTEVDINNWDDHFNTNVRGGFFCAKEAIKDMIKQRFGRIIFISSQSGLIGIPGQSVYCSSKGAIINMVRAMGVEYAKYGITVNSIAPTFIETNLTRKRLQNKEFLDFVIGKIPTGRLATCEDVANAVVYLASEEANMVNCVNFPVDGGWTAW